MQNFTAQVTLHPRSRLRRFFKAFWRQKRRTPLCSDQPRLDGRLALVTGGNDGIGFEISKGLAQRGAEVILAARSELKAQEAIRIMRAEAGVEAHFVSLDLADLASVSSAGDEIARRWPDRKLDLVVANAGVWPERYARSKQGYETAFAVNVLGHFVLLRRCIEQSLLAVEGRIVILTGDIYILAKACSPDFEYGSRWGGQMAYCRSKLGDIWMARELACRYPELQVYCVHPGVVASGLGGQGQAGRVADWVRKAVLLPPAAGAQTALICATQPGLMAGGYYHNTMGQVVLHKHDPAANNEKAAEFWGLLEELANLKEGV